MINQAVINFIRVPKGSTQHMLTAAPAEPEPLYIEFCSGICTAKVACMQSFFHSFDILHSLLFGHIARSIVKSQQLQQQWIIFSGSTAQTNISRFPAISV